MILLTIHICEIITTVNVDERNQLFLLGKIDRDDLWPKVKEYEDQSFQFRWEFGLEEIPQSPGVITIRGARQTGKSTWLELKLLDTLETFGKGTAFFLNGDYITGAEEFEQKLIELERSFYPKAKVKRIFVDEITQIKGWERIVKRLIDSGHLREILLITTGSNAADLRRGTERLPGRKGSLARSEYIFLPISYREFRHQTRAEIGTFESDVLWAYVLSGGSPLAIKDLYHSEKLSDPFISLIYDWVIGDIAASGRSRILFLNLLRKLYETGPAPISYTKLAKEAGLANNTAALDYIEKLADLLCIEPSMAWNHEKNTGVARKPSKFPFINLSFAFAFHPKAPRYIHEVKQLQGRERGAVYEWVVAQELWRRQQLELQRKGSPLKQNQLRYYSSKEHEIDFVTTDRSFIEVKAGQARPAEFAWFIKTFPQKSLLVISDATFETEWINSISLEAFLKQAPTELYYDDDKER